MTVPVAVECGGGGADSGDLAAADLAGDHTEDVLACITASTER
jgi:hypothetical protein